MKRRSFIQRTTLLGGIGLSPFSFGFSSNKNDLLQSNVYVTMDQEKVSFYAKKIKENIKVVHIADTHLFMDDDRGIPYTEFSNRMAKAYNQTTHFKTREKTTPMKCFENTLAYAKQVNADVITLVGDIFSFPSELAVEWVSSKLEAIGIPYIYVAGNHDWHYEGMSGKLDTLRDTWIDNRLLSLYQGNNPLMAAYDLSLIHI